MEYKEIYKLASKEADRRIEAGEYEKVDTFDDKADFKAEGLIRRPKKKSGEEEQEYDFLMEYFLNLRASFMGEKSYMPEDEGSGKAEMEGKKASKDIAKELEEIRSGSEEEEDLDV